MLISRLGFVWNRWDLILKFLLNQNIIILIEYSTIKLYIIIQPIKRHKNDILIYNQFNISQSGAPIWTFSGGNSKIINIYYLYAFLKIFFATPIFQRYFYVSIKKCSKQKIWEILLVIFSNTCYCRSFGMVSYLFFFRIR